MRRMRAELISCASNTSAHGIPRIVSADRASLRTLWLLIYGTATLALLMHFSMLLHLYLQNAVTTSISYEAIPFEFPDVTVCAGSIYSVRLIEHYFRNRNCTRSRCNVEDVDVDLDEQKLLQDAANFSDNDFRELEEHFKLHIRHVILFCEYYGEPCDLEHFSNFTVMKYRRREMCYTYHPPNRRASTEIELGLILAIYAENVDNDFSARLKNLRGHSTAYAGVRLVIHEPGCCPHASSEALAIETGSTSEVILKIEQINRLPVPKADMTACLSDKPAHVRYCNDLDERNDSVTFSPTIRDCQIRRMQEILWERCHCVSSRYPVPYDLCDKRNTSGQFSVTYCDDMDRCVMKQTAFVGRNYEEYVTKHCPNTCIQTTWYPKLGASIKWASADVVEGVRGYIEEAHNRLLNKSRASPFHSFWNISISDYKALSRDFVELIVYPATHAGNKIVEKLAYPLESFVSEVGGIMGLWIGSSVITFLEPLELICKAIETVVCDYRRRKKRPEANLNDSNDTNNKTHQNACTYTTLSIYSTPAPDETGPTSV